MMSERPNDRSGLKYKRTMCTGILAALAFTAASTPVLALECDKSAALNVTLMMKELAKVKTEGDHIAVNWTYAFEDQPRNKRLQMTRTYADTDACLTGVAREIHFYRKKKLVGIASPSSGIRLID